MDFPTNSYRPLFEEELDLAPFEESRKFTPCRCPLHDDRNPSAGLWEATGVFTCGSCGTFSPERLLVALGRADTVELARVIVDEFRRESGLSSYQLVKPPKITTKSKYATQLYNDSVENGELLTMYAEARGLTLETLAKWGVRFLEAKYTPKHWNRDSIVFPYWDNGKFTGVRFRDANNRKSVPEGMALCLYGVDSLSTPGTVAVIVEGESDVLRTSQELGPGYTVVGPAGSYFRDTWGREFSEYDQVIIIPQADTPSLKLVEQVTKALGNKVKTVELPWSRGEEGKDICDWLVYHSGEELRELVSSEITPTSAGMVSGYEFSKYSEELEETLIPNLLQKGQLVVIGGPPKSFKTFLTLNLIRCLLSGESFLGVPEWFGPEVPPKVGYIMEEGSKAEFSERTNLVLEGVDDWEGNSYWGHKLGIQLDTKEGLKKVLNIIKTHSLDVIVLDPFQNLHSVDENSAKDMGIVFSNIYKIMIKYPRLVIILNHHFNKSGDVVDLWNSFRGSSKIGGTADLGIFIAKRKDTATPSAKIAIDGRTYRESASTEGKPYVKVTFNPLTGLLELDTGILCNPKTDALIALVMEQKNYLMELTTAAKHFQVNTETVKNWIGKAPSLLAYVRASKGKKAYIQYIGDID